MLSMRTWSWAPIALLGLSSTVWAGEHWWNRWYTSQSPTVPGSRQSYHDGKMWPLAPRSTGPKEPFVHVYHTNANWPDPYRWQDRTNMRASMNAQVDRGWLTTQTLYDQHFDPETNELNLAGRHHLTWILQYAPPQRRQPYVQAATTQAASDVRVATAQAAAVNIVGAGAPPVQLRICQPYDGSGVEAEKIRRDFLDQSPSPRLPYVPLINGGNSATTSSAGS